MSTVLRSTTFQLAFNGADGLQGIKSFTRAVQDADATVDKLNEQLGENATVTYKSVRSKKELTAEARALVNQMEKSANNTKRLSAEYEHMAATVGKTGEELAILNAMQRLGANATAAQREQVTQSIKSYYALTAAQNGQQSSLRNSRGIMQNFGWQMQDTIVQLQMNTSAFVVLSQQGSQMAAAFGPTGAIVGAVIALAGVVGGTLFTSLSNTTKATETLEKATASIAEVMKIAADGTLSFTEEMEKLYEIDSKSARLRMTSAIFDANKAIRESGKGITEAFDEIGVSWYKLTVNDLAAGGKSLDYITTLTEQITGLDDSSKSFNTVRSRVQFLVNTMERLKSQGASVGTINQVGEALQSVSTVVSKDNDKFNEFVKSTLKMVVSFKEGKTTATELQKAMDDLGNSIKNNSKKTKDGVSDIIKAFESEYKSLTKQTESIDQEYSRRKSIIDDFVTHQGKSDDQSKDAYAKLNQWRIDEVNKVTAKQLAIDNAREKALDKSYVTLYNSLIKATNSTSQEYDKRKAIIDEHVARVGLLDSDAALAYAALEEWKTEQIQKAYDKRETIRRTIEKAQVKQGYRSGDKDSENNLFERNLLTLAAQKQAIGEDELKERQRIDALIESEVVRHNQAITDADKLRIENQVQTIGLAVAMMTNLTDLMTNGVEQVRSQTEEMNGFQKAMFIMSQIMAASMALINGISLGMKLAEAFPLIAPAMIAAGTGLGAAQSGAIMGVTLAGAFDNGGDIPSGQMGIVSEYGDELVNGQLIQGPARVTSRKDTAQLLKEGQGGSTNVNMKVLVENKIPNASYDVQQIDENTVKIIAQQVFSKNIDSGVSSVMSNRNSKSSKSMRSHYNVKSNL
jgi:hypothetical protein